MNDQAKQLKLFGITCLILFGLFLLTCFIGGINTKKEQQTRQIIKHDTVLVCHVADDFPIDRDMPLKDYKDLQKLLEYHHIPYAEWWGYLSIQECGWNWESYNATINHNMFGLSYCYFKNKHDCVNYLVNDWMALDPPRKDEDFFQFLRRRKYNPNMNIYEHSIRGCKFAVSGEPIQSLIVK